MCFDRLELFPESKKRTSKRSRREEEGQLVPTTHFIFNEVYFGGRRVTRGWRAWSFTESQVDLAPSGRFERDDGHVPSRKLADEILQPQLSTEPRGTIGHMSKNNQKHRQKSLRNR